MTVQSQTLAGQLDERHCKRRDLALNVLLWTVTTVVIVLLSFGLCILVYPVGGRWAVLAMAFVGSAAIGQRVGWRARDEQARREGK